MRIDVFTLVPHAYAWLTEQRPVASVLGGELELRLFNYRDSTPLRAGQVDDEPYGGGAGMVLRVDVVAAALEAAYGGEPPGPVIALTPKGRQLTQPVVEELAALPAFTLLSSRFEGFDERIVEHLATDAISVGPYVLSNGDLPAMIVLDAVARRLPGALAEGSGELESFSAELGGGLEYPHYTRPAEFRGWPRAGRAAVGRPRAGRGLAAGAGAMSDDWGSYRREPRRRGRGRGGRGRPRSRGAGRLAGGRAGHRPLRSHWPDDEPEESDESASGWPTPGSTWQRPDYDDAPREWQRTSRDTGTTDTTRSDDLFPDDAEDERYAARHSRDPLARLFPGLPRGVRVTLDWILTIAGAILIVLALKQWVVNPYRIPSSSMEPNLNCAKGPANPGCLGDSSDRVLACRICLDFGRNPSRGDIVVFNTPSGPRTSAAKAARSSSA